MKKLITVAIIAALAISCVACSNSLNNRVRDPASENEVNSTKPTDSSTGAETQEAVIPETVLVDQAGIKITAKSLENDAVAGASVKLLIENNSGEDLTFRCRNSSVNGYMIDNAMSVDVVDGEKADDKLTFLRSDLEACGISTVSDMEFAFHAYTSDNLETYLNTPLIQIKTSLADTYVYTFDDSGELVYDGNEIKVVIKGLSEDASIFGPSMIVYLENSSGKSITVQAQDISVNGHMLDIVCPFDVGAGKHAIDYISFNASELEANGIRNIEDVKLTFHIFDISNGNTIVDTDLISLSF